MQYQPGEKAPRSGTYKMIDSQGRTVNTVYVHKDDTLPPCVDSGCHYEG